jgi:hypothetical protein
VTFVPFVAQSFVTFVLFVAQIFVSFVADSFVCFVAPSPDRWIAGLPRDAIRFRQLDLPVMSAPRSCARPRVPLRPQQASA